MKPPHEALKRHAATSNRERAMPCSLRASDVAEGVMQPQSRALHVAPLPFVTRTG